MAHLHDVLDDDPHFKIDADSREIIRTSEKELLLIQDDHNSERCTFDIPKYIDGHDMALCNAIRVHFINVSAENPTETSVGLYEVDDLRVSTNDPSTMVFSWLISSEGTALIGTLSFLVEFICKNSKNIIEYSWHTGIYTGGIVSKGMNNSEIVIGQHYDVLDRWVALIEQEGDRVRTDTLARINDAANQAEKNSVSAINSHAENVKKDLVLYGLDVGDVLVQETGNSEEKIMSQASVTEEINRLDGEINNQITDVRSEFNAVKTELSNFMTDISLYNELPLTSGADIKNWATIEIGKKYAVESNKTDTTWGFDLKFKSLKCHNTYNEVFEHVKSAGISLESTVDRYATGLITIQLLRVEIHESVAEGVDVYAKHIYEINGERFSQDIFIGAATDTSDKYTIDSSEYIVEGCTKLYEVKDVAEQSAYKVEANGITSITKTNTAVVNGVVTHTYTILLDDGTTTTFDVKDGVGISSFSRHSQGDYEDTYKVEFTNGTSMTFKVPNNNTVGIETSDSGALIHAEDLVPLAHTVKVRVRSANEIPYPYNLPSDPLHGVTFTQNENGSISVNGMVAEGEYAFVKLCSSLPLIDGKKYYFGDDNGSTNLYLAYRDEAGVERGVANAMFTWKKTYELVSIFLQYYPGDTVDETIYPILCEAGVYSKILEYIPYVNPSTVTLTRCCKNLLPPPIIEAGKTKSGITLTDNGDGTITVNGTATNNLAFVLYQGSMRLKGTYTLSGMTGGSGETYYIQPTFSVGTARGLVDGSRVYEDIDCVMTEIKLNIAAGTSLDNLKISLMLEVGDTATEFEEYHGRNHAIYGSSGTPVSNVTSVTPIMNLLTDKEGVIIDATYNVDPRSVCKSAYDIAVKKGFKGTESEWLESLHGRDGVDGNVENIVQTPGDNADAVMSQKATTDYVKDYVPKVATRNLMNLTFENALIYSNGDSVGEYLSLDSGTDGVATPGYNEVVGGKTYTLSWEPIESAGIQLYEYKSDKSYIKHRDVYAGSGVYTFVVDSACAYIRLYIYTWYSPTPFETLVPDKIQMEEGFRKTEYVPPRQIDNSVINLRAHPDVDRLGYIKGIATRNLMNLTFENAVLNLSTGEFTEVNTGKNHIASRDYIEVTGGEKYTLSWKKKGTGVGIYVLLYDANGTFIKTLETDATFNTTLTITTPEECCYIRIHIYSVDDQPWETHLLEDFQLERGVRATAYIPPIVIDIDNVDLEQLADKMPPAKFDYSAYGLPILEFDGNITAMSKDVAVDLTYKYGDITGSCTLKWQGSSSLAHPKKNYTVKFDTAFEAKEGWGEQKKYCLKANYIDFSHSRNICCAKLWGGIVKTRVPENTTLKSLPNAGAIDGFPICVVINGEYKGVYTFNIPKDGWMFGMGDGAQEAIICADSSMIGACTFDALATLDGDFEVEYAPDENNTDWVKTSINNLIQACMDCQSENDFENNVAPLLDIESAIDYLAFCLVAQNYDGISKNYLLTTYDGVKWFFSAYDMDSTFGLWWDGSKFIKVTATCSLDHLTNDHAVFGLIKTYKADELKARYKELVNGALSEETIVETFTNFAGSIPKALLDEEVKIWPTIPSTSVNNVSQIIDFNRRRRAFIDPQIESL